MANSEPVAFPHPKGLPVTHWFSARGSVVRRGVTSQVFVGGTLIGSFEADEPLACNPILVQLSEDPRCHLGRLAGAFDISTERLRRIHCTIAVLDGDRGVTQTGRRGSSRHPSRRCQGVRKFV